jgi:hypothetical protein
MKTLFATTAIAAVLLAGAPAWALGDTTAKAEANNENKITNTNMNTPVAKGGSAEARATGVGVGVGIAGAEQQQEAEANNDNRDTLTNDIDYKTETRPSPPSLGGSLPGSGAAGNSQCVLVGRAQSWQVGGGGSYAGEVTGGTGLFGRATTEESLDVMCAINAVADQLDGIERDMALCMNPIARMAKLAADPKACRGAPNAIKAVIRTESETIASAFAEVAVVAPAPAPVAAPAPAPVAAPTPPAKRDLSVCDGLAGAVAAACLNKAANG